MDRRTVKSQGNRASDETVPAAAPRKPIVASDHQGYYGLPQLEAFLAGVIASLFGDSHSAISNSLRAYDWLALKEYHNIHVN
jgi:hypothetical protein